MSTHDHNPPGSPRMCVADHAGADDGPFLSVTLFAKQPQLKLMLPEFHNWSLQAAGLKEITSYRSLYPDEKCGGQRTEQKTIVSTT